MDAYSLLKAIGSLGDISGKLHVTSVDLKIFAETQKRVEKMGNFQEFSFTMTEI